MPNTMAAVIEGKVTVTETGTYSISGNHIHVPVGDGLSIQTDLLHEVCFTEVSPLSRDLSILLGAVKCADRSVRRQHGRGWARSLQLQIPVYELATWRRTDVETALVDALQYVTGDTWQIDFVKRRRKSAFTAQPPLLASPSAHRAFIPFSHGLDSYAQSELLTISNPGLDVIRVRLRASKGESSMKSLGQAAKQQLTPVPVAASIDEPRHPEQSFRTRPFLFDSLAAYAAILSDGGVVVIPENGQGSLGGSLIRMGAEAPHRSCHPGFTTRLSRFLACLTGKQINFEHPALFQTKGQVLTALQQVQPDSDAWLLKHPSCSYDARHANRNHKLVHCGVCGNCLLRRVSLHAAGIADPTPYKVNDLHATSLVNALMQGDEPPNLHAYTDIARNAARSMQRMADLVENAEPYRMAAEVDGLAHYQGRARSEVREALSSMLNQHRHEWMAFLGHTGKSSWVAQLARG